MDFKSTAKQLVPPVLWQGLKRIKNDWSAPSPVRPVPGAEAAKRPVGFFGNYESFDAALAACGNRADENYQQDVILDSTRSRTLPLRKEMKQGGPVITDPKNMRLLAVFEKILLENKKDSLHVVDFGGALGNHYFGLKPLLPKNIGLSWKVLELPRTALLGKKDFAEGELSFFGDVGELQGQRVDVVFASGSIQYTLDPQEFLEKLFALQGRWFVVDRIPLSHERRNRILVQTVPAQIYDASYPMHLMTESYFLDFCKQNKFEPRLRWHLPDQVFWVDGTLEVPCQGMLLERMG